LKLAAQYLPGGGELLTADEAVAATKRRASSCDQVRSWGWQLGWSQQCSAGPGLSGSAFGHTGFTGASVWGEGEAGTICVLLTNRNHPSQRENDLDPLRRRFHVLARAAENVEPASVMRSRCEGGVALGTVRRRPQE
jgi:CubicO group peptidase (beta-lactamase class C family)